MLQRSLQAIKLHVYQSSMYLVRVEKNVAGVALSGYMQRSVRIVCFRAGSYGRALLDGSGEGLAVEPWQVAAALGFTAIALAYLGRVAKDVRSSSLLVLGMNAILGSNHLRIILQAVHFLPSEALCVRRHVLYSLLRPYTMGWQGKRAFLCSLCRRLMRLTWRKRHDL